MAENPVEIEVSEHEMPEVRQNAPGRPHLTYYVPDYQAVFCWAGNFEEPIEMTVGYDEKPREFIRFDVGAFTGLDGQDDFVGWFDRFKAVCNHFVWLYFEEGGKDLQPGQVIAETVTFD